MSGDIGIVSSGLTTIQAGAVTASKISSGTITNTQINSSAAIDVSKLAALTPSTAVATNSSGFLVSSATTATQLGYSSNVTSDIQAQINAASSATSPTGAIVMFGASSAPSGWLLCNGAAVSRTTYATLFGVIGTTFGSGDGSTTFNVPTSANLLPMGAGSSVALGATAGSTTVSITDPGHTHTQNAHGHTGTSSQSGANIIVPTLSGGGDWPFGSTNVTTTTTNVAATNEGSATNAFANTSTTTATNNSNTTGISATALPPVFGVTFIIKT
jgi:microcystin-dependent protein